MDNYKIKELVIEDFVIESMKSIRSNISELGYPLCKDTILFYTSCINLSIIELLNDKSAKSILKMNKILNKKFFSMLSTFHAESIYKLDKSNITNDSTIFLIWCVDSFFYFFKYSNSPYKVLTKYSMFIEKVLTQKNYYDDFFKMSNDFCNLIN